MHLDSIFTVKNDRLGLLDEHEAVDFFKKLLWAEARRIGIEISNIHVPSAIHVSDGGVDAAVDDAQIAIASGLIKPGKTSYQIKSGGSFKPWQKSEIKRALFGKKDPDKQNLGESIRACFDNSGTYILVCTGIDLVDSQRRNARKHIEKYLKLCDYSDTKVNVWSQSDLIGFLESFPSLAIQLNGYGRAHFQTHESWLQNDDMHVPFVQGQLQEELIARIQNELRRNEVAIHVRVLGEPGIGKTKLVLEATKTDDLSPLVIYCSALQFRKSDLMNNLLRSDNHFSAVLVIDECDPHNRFQIWDRLGHRGPRIKLVTIYNDYDPLPEDDILPLEISRLEDDQIRAIIQGYEISSDQADRYLGFCDGSPRMAHHVGRTLESYPGNPSQLFTDDYLYRSFYIDFRKEDSNSQEIQRRELVLQYIALFKRFGFERSVVPEAQALATKVKVANPLITWNRFQQIVDTLRKRKVLQGEFTLYLTPKALHIKLWTEWWKIHGNSFDLEEFTQDLPPKLVEWFYEMFVYAAESEAASEIVRDLLGPNGPFQQNEYLKTKLGGSFFLALTEADPDSALRCLMRTMGTWDRETLLEVKEGRRNVILALEKMAARRRLFTDAANLLLALGEAENEGFSNNASGVFARLFSPARGKLAPTEESPLGRLPILKKAFASGSKQRRALALKACDAALTPRSSLITHFVKFQGLREEPKRWMPKTYGELWEAYQGVWELLDEQLRYLPEDERKEAADILLNHARYIGRIPNLADTVVDTLATIARKPYAPRRQTIKTINGLLHYSGKDLPLETRERCEQLMAELVPPDFHSMMQRYVGMNLREDLHRDENGTYIDEAQSRIETLAAQAAANPHLLKSNLDWLVTSQAIKGYQFGEELGKKDGKFSFLPSLLDAQRSADRNASVAFLAGYFRAIFDSDLALWETKLDALIDDTQLNHLIPELTSRTGLTDRAGRRILNLARKGIIAINDFKTFTYSAAIKNLSEEVFNQWIAFLLSSIDKSGLSIALDLYNRYYVLQEPEPALRCDLTFRLLTHPSLFEESDAPKFDDMIEYDWTEIAKVFLQYSRDKSLELVKPMLAHFGEEGTIVGVFSETCSILDAITEEYSAQVWEHVSSLLEQRTHFSRITDLEQWLREGGFSDRETAKPALTRMPRQKIWEWVDADTKNRARYLTPCVPKPLSPDEWKTSLAREVLVRYGNQKEVRGALIGNYLTDTWHGPPSVHYQEKQDYLSQIRDIEDNADIIDWIDEFVEGLDPVIRDEKIHEERELW